MLVNGSTATDGLSGSASAGISDLGVAGRRLHDDPEIGRGRGALSHTIR